MKIKELKNKIDLLDYIKDQDQEIEKIGENLYRLNPCPVCGHDDHFTVYAAKNTYSSFSGCCEGGSIVDYLMEIESLSKNEAIKKLRKISEGDDLEVSKTETMIEATTNNEDINKMVEEAKKNECEYYRKRGLSEEIIKKYELGYLPDGAKFGKDFKYVLPVSKNHVIVRTNIADKNDRYRNIGDTEILNVKYLEDPSLTENEIFLTEGIFDALSLETIGKPAVSINSANMAKKLIDVLERNKSSLQDKIIILAFDNDKAGEEVAKTIEDAINSNDLHCDRLDLAGYKDANHYFTEDPEIFKQELNDLYFRGTAYEYLERDFKNEQLKRKDEKIIKTDFPGLDEVLGGGMYPGLYCLGSTTSLGKTALALQMADRIAEQGHQVIFFNLEMATYEMVCRSIARVMYEETGNEDFTTADILKGNFFNQVIKTTKPFYDAKSFYRDNIAKNMTFIEGDFSTNVSKLKSNIKKHLNRTNINPVVFVDYLQVLKPSISSYSDKQHIDFCILELKRISRELDLPVIVISSFNRDAYGQYVSFKSFKESGSIEYTADVIFGLQLRKDENEDINEVKNQEPRPLKLVTLKNRRGKSYSEIDLDYYPKQNYFVQPD